MKERNLLLKIKATSPSENKVIRTKWKFWPSEASCELPNGKVIGKCMRASFYQWTGADVTNPAEAFIMTLAEIGNFLEEKTRTEYKRKGIYPEEANQKANRKCSVEIFSGGVLSGKVDILVEDENENIGVEVKSYSNSTHKIVARPKDNHLLQAFLYAVFFEPKQDFFLLYYRPSMVSEYAKSDVYHTVSFMKVGEEIYPVINGKVDKRISINKIINRFKKLKLHVEEEVLPPREFTKSSKSCTYCNYRDRCWNQDGEGKKIGE